MKTFLEKVTQIGCYSSIEALSRVQVLLSAIFFTSCWILMVSSLLSCALPSRPSSSINLFFPNIFHNFPVSSNKYFNQKSSIQQMRLDEPRWTFISHLLGATFPSFFHHLMLKQLIFPSFSSNLKRETNYLTVSAAFDLNFLEIMISNLCWYYRTF